MKAAFGHKLVTLTDALRVNSDTRSTWRASSLYYSISSNIHILQPLRDL